MILIKKLAAKIDFLPGFTKTFTDFVNWQKQKQTYTFWAIGLAVDSYYGDILVSF